MHLVQKQWNPLSPLSDRAHLPPLGKQSNTGVIWHQGSHPGEISSFSLSCQSFDCMPTIWRICTFIIYIMGFSGGAGGKEPTCQCRRHGFGPWIEKIPWRWKWQPTLVFRPGKSHGQRSLAGYSPWDCKESDTSEHAQARRKEHIIKKYFSRYLTTAQWKNTQSFTREYLPLLH